jgi:hypothetical protein
MRFSASYDRTAKIVSGLVCLVLLAAVVAVHNFIAGCLALLVLALSLAYSPRGYVMDGRMILVKRLAGMARIELDDVREARKATRQDFSGCIRLWGSGGLFGYYGLFSTSKLGKSTWYVTNRSKAVVLITAAKTALLSPDDTDGFLAAIEAVAPITAAQTTSPVEPPPPSRSLGKWITAAALIGAGGLWLWMLAYSPGVPRYTLTPESLTIHDRFYPVTLRESDVAVDEIRIVDLARDPEWRPTARTNGFAVAHYRSGWFRVASGAKVRLYQANSPRVVLLPPKGGGAPVLYQAADPEKFVNEIRAVWSSTARSGANGGKWKHYAL